MLPLTCNNNIPTAPSFKIAMMVAVTVYGGYSVASNTYQYCSETEQYQSLSESDLSKMSMSFSELSLKEDWDNEDDDHWANFPAI